MEAPTDEQLLADYFAGDRTALGTLVQRYHQDLYRFVLRFTNSAAAAEDVVQDTFLQVHLSGQTFDPSRKFKPWLFTIAANKARDWLRSRTRRQEVPLDAPMSSSTEGSQSFRGLLEDDALSVVEELQADEKRRTVQRVVQEMPDNLREVLILGYFHRLPYKDMAEVLGIPLGTVKSRLHAAVGQFADRYKAEVERRAQERQAQE